MFNNLKFACVFLNEIKMRFGMGQWAVSLCLYDIGKQLKSFQILVYTAEIVVR
jgi:hypothetical protein